MNKLGFWLLLLFAASCASKKSEDEKKEGAFFPVVSYLKSQAKAIDTSLYRIMKIETTGPVSDTQYIRREEFKTYAADFLNLPDITSSKWKDDYKEDKIYDEDLKSVILTYTTSEAENPIRREDVMLNGSPNEYGNSEVHTIIINKMETEDDLTTEKNMVWYVNKRFIIVTKTQKGTQPEQVKKLQVIWNDFPSQ
ncbi:MAG TPA: hypothetical protein VHK91_08755 [Flavisolibacter sp.]|jgi:hypothetical protein|nr:hypothetical protein [Flavisolibacter sp.]